jgi:hypothetical protein
MEPPPKPGNKIIIRRRPRGVRCDSSTGTGSFLHAGDSVTTIKRPEHKATVVKVSKSENITERYKILLANQT